MTRLRPKVKTPPANEVGRKLLHFAALALPALMLVTGKDSLWVLVPLAAVGVGCDVLRGRSTRFAEIIHRTLGPLMRESEFPSVPGQVIINGGTWVCCAMAGLALLCPIHIAAAAMAIHMASDATAAVVGHALGRHRWPGTPRTVEGSLTYLATGLLVMAVWPAVPFWQGTIGVVVATAAEIPERPLNDNLRVPAAAALALVTLQWLAS